MTAIGKAAVLLQALGVLAFAAGTPCAVGESPVFPLKVSANKRFLVDQRDRPFFVNGEAGWRVLFAIPFDELRTYLEDRKSKGITTILCQFLPDAYGEGRTHLGGDMSDAEGEHAFFDRDVSRPNPKYWNRIDRAVAEATSRGFLLLVSTHYLGCCRDGWLEILEAPPNTDEEVKEYGRWIGRRYKDVPNIVWVGGGDHDETRRSVLISEGIAETDPNHLHTFHASARHSARERLADPGWLTLDFTYTYYPGMDGRTDQFHVYAHNYQAWSRKPAMPFVMSESAYELERYAPPLFIRRQAYWSYLGGACGHLYGHRATYSHPPGWLDRLDDPGARHMGVLNRAFLGRRWWDLEPDWAHNVVIAGRGTFNGGTMPGGEDYVTAARTRDGSLVMAYLPSARTVTVQMTRLAGPVTASWFDPTSGASNPAAGGPLPNRGSRDFTPPGPNGDGDGDWLLVLEAAAPPAPARP